MTTPKTGFGPRPGSRAGFALPAAIFALVVVALLITSGFYMAGQEFRIGQSTERTTQAFYLAEMGLNNVVAGWAPGGAAPWSGMIDDCPDCAGGWGDGRWDVQILPVDDNMFYIESTGVIDQGGLLAGASRTVGQLVRRFVFEMPGDAALTTRGDVDVRGGALIDGMDQPPPNWTAEQREDFCPGWAPENKHGVVVGETDQVTTTGQGEVSGCPDDEPGCPGWKTAPLNDDSFLKFGDLDWDDLVSMASLRIAAGSYSPWPAFEDGSCDQSATSNWGGIPDSNPNNGVTLCQYYFPIIHVTGDLNVQGGGLGQGILLVEGDIRAGGGFEFNGLILTKGQFRTVGNGAKVTGAVLAANGIEVLEDEFDDSQYVGSSIIQYSSCALAAVQRNTEGLSSIRPLVARSWVDLTPLLADF